MNPIHSIVNLLHNELGVVLSSTLARLLLAAILGGIIGLERQLRHRPAGLRTNMFICFGAAMFTVLSRQVAGTPSDSAASEVVRRAQRAKTASKARTALASVGWRRAVACI